MEYTDPLTDLSPMAADLAAAEGSPVALKRIANRLFGGGMNNWDLSAIFDRAQHAISRQISTLTALFTHHQTEKQESTVQRERDGAAQRARSRRLHIEAWLQNHPNAPIPAKISEKDDDDDDDDDDPDDDDDDDLLVSASPLKKKGKLADSYGGAAQLTTIDNAADDDDTPVIPEPKPSSWHNLMQHIADGARHLIR